ncbi:MAG TPA: ATP-grasp domain-containing protein [Anaerolineaceae bacterium]|nr:ATP-grasp domain-containing protein [Anaerolineaceae bacterium]
MNYIYLSPHFPTNYYPFVIKLREVGANVLGIGDMHFSQLSDPLKRHLTEYYRVSDMHNYDELLRAVGYFTHRYGKIDRFESHNEYWLETEAHIRTDFNIEGPKSSEITWVKQKSLMKERYQSAGIPVARGRIIHDYTEAQNFIAEIGMPVVAKPDKGVGANATYKIHNQSDLQHFFASKPPVDYLFEEFIQGQVVSFDGLADQDGKVVFCTLDVFRQGVMETVNHNLDFFYYSLREIPDDLMDIGLRTVEAFNIRARFFHLEYFRTSEGRIIALEVNMRPPGGLTTDMYNYANDIDIYAEYARMIMHNRFDARVTLPHYCGYLGRKHHIRYTLSHAEVLQQFSDILVHHQPMDAVMRDALGDYAYILRSSHLEDILDAERMILAAQCEPMA